MRTSKSFRLGRILVTQFTITGLLLFPSVAAQGPVRNVHFADGRVLLQSASDTIEVDREAAVLWVNRQPIEMDRGFLDEIQRAVQIVARDPQGRGLDSGAATLSRESVSKLQRIRDALNRPEDLVGLHGMEQCGPQGMGWGLSVASFWLACTAAVASTAGAAAPCYLAIAVWTTSTWALGDCLGRNQPGNGRPDGGHDDDSPFNDSDQDGIIDGLDGCPFDRDKVSPGECGCGVPDTDADLDGTPDCVEECSTDDCEEDECTPIEILNGECSNGLP